MALRPMLIHLPDPSRLDDLCLHYRRSGFTADPVDRLVVDVARPDAPDAEQERREVLLHLQVWCAMRSDAPAVPLL
jgi:hypothetical protein